jgi:hypothetical protein
VAAFPPSIQIMKSLLSLLILSLTSAAALAQIPAEYYSRTLFTDDFSADGFGKRWGHYKSSSVVKGGILMGITAETSDHPAVDHIIIAPERDLEVSVKFQYASDKAQSFNLWFDDKGYKESHAGHICNVNVSPKNVTIADAKTGTFRNDINERKKSPGGLTAEDKEFLKKMSVNLPVKLSLQDWHTLVVRTKEDDLEVTIDGKAVGFFKSPGISHETKTLVSLTTNRIDVNYDDFSIKAAAKP